MNVGVRKNRGERLPEAMLVLVTILWGVTFPLIRIALDEMSPEAFVFSRFGVAAVFLLPWVFRSGGTSLPSTRTVLRGIFLGFIIWIAFFTQTIALETISSARAAFITATSVLMVPLMSPIFQAYYPKRSDWFAAFIALLGLYFLLEPDVNGLSRGDLFVFACAFAVALHIHLLQIFSKTESNPFWLSYIQILTIFLCSSFLLWGRFSEVWVIPSLQSVVSVLVCGVLATCLVFLLLTHFQKRTTTERAAVIFALEPVFACLFAYFILNEALTFRAVVGGGLIFIAVSGCTFNRFFRSLLHRAKLPVVARRQPKQSLQ